MEAFTLDGVLARLRDALERDDLAVVDTHNRLVGVVTVDDVVDVLVDVLVDEAPEDIQRLAGAQPPERSYLDTGSLTIARKRIGWLMLLFLTATLTGSVMRLFRTSCRPW